MSLTLESVKEHLRVTHTAEDSVIQSYWDAAEGHVAEYLGDDLPDPMPQPIQAAVLLLVGDLYVNRTRQADRVLHENSAYALLLNPYRTTEVL
ncbi:head-tail connector protein [Marinobacter nauticus]|uniref:head-tail connector protein n=1 Tax=Marinobacter nauticus TaxID=2743 RepID=UPI001C94BC39|nr:head-tail connector protein [Marinobacter nauticus]MBY6102953.1 head-tail connector protein [Marinobacter nauticus]